MYNLTYLVAHLVNLLDIELIHSFFAAVGRGGWVRVLRKTTLGDSFLCAQLLWRVRQRGRDDECG